MRASARVETRGRSWPAPPRPAPSAPLKGARAAALLAVGRAPVGEVAPGFPAQAHFAHSHTWKRLPASLPCPPLSLPARVADSLPIRLERSARSQHHDRLGSGGRGGAAARARARGAGGLLNHAARLRAPGGGQRRPTAQEWGAGGRRRGSGRDAPCPEDIHPRVPRRSLRQRRGALR